MRGARRYWVRSDAPSVASLDALQEPLPFLHREQVDQSLAVGGYKGVKVDQSRDAIRHPVSDGCNDHAAIAMADQGYLAQVFKMQDAENVLYVRFEII